jgi:hypothetical protein
MGQHTMQCAATRTQPACAAAAVLSIDHVAAEPFVCNYEKPSRDLCVSTTCRQRHPLYREYTSRSEALRGTHVVLAAKPLLLLMATAVL